MRRQISFFLTPTDLEALLADVEQEAHLQYRQAGVFDTVEGEVLSSWKQIPDLGVCQVGDQSQESTYLVQRASQTFQTREVRQRRGGLRYAVDQLANPRSISFRPGGRFGEDAIIAGQVGTTSNARESLELYELFRREIGHRFRKVRSYYVGVEAEDCLAAGSRLTANIHAPRDYDLDP